MTCRCGRPAAPDRKHCAACLRKYSARQKERRAALLSIGRCTCGERVARGKANCATCLERGAEAMRTRHQRLRTRGLCVDCGAPTGGPARCPPCSKQSNATWRRCADRRRAEGTCIDCGRRPAAEGVAKCERCRRRDQKRALRRLEVLRPDAVRRLPPSAPLVLGVEAAPLREHPALLARALERVAVCDRLAPFERWVLERLWAPPEGTLLREVGASVSLSRERIRQVAWDAALKVAR